jgi:S1-C subfamily serine protease
VFPVLRRLLPALALLAPLALPAAAQEPAAEPGALVALERDVQAVVDRVLPSLAEVTVHRIVAEDPLNPRRETIVLSGFVWSADGLIVSLGRVFESAESIQVRVGGRDAEAQVVGVDPETAVALLRVAPPPGGLVAAARGDSAALRRGSVTVSFGAAYGLHGAVALGIVAGTERAVLHEGQRLDGLLQLTTAVGPGDPGGPVADARGEVVAVTGGALRPAGESPLVGQLRRDLQEWLRRLAGREERAGGAELPRSLFGGQQGGAGYAVPLARIEEVVSRLSAEASGPRPWLGLQVLTLDAAVARRVGVESEAGALVLGVVEGSPAAKAGLREHDVLLRFDDTAIDDVRTLKRLVQTSAAGAQARLVVLRGSERMELDLTLTPR